jgi:putative spermidine/putrescine transport system permease protein
MTDATAGAPLKAGQMLAADGTPLKTSLRRALRAQKLRALMLIAPLLIFVLVTFILPIGDMLFRAVENDIVPNTLPATISALDDWDPATSELPGEPAFAALHEDLTVAVEEKTNTRLGQRLNYEYSGFSSLMRGVARDLRGMDPAQPFKEQFIASDQKWGDPTIWETLKLYSGRYTSGYLLNALDMQLTPDGPELKPAGERIYLKLFLRTMAMSLGITFCCLLLGYPIAFLLASLPLRSSNLILILVLLPFWTSLLVRTASWKVLLQQQGVINDLLVWLGVIDNANRLVMINNATGTTIAMTHILLPFMILPLFSVMKTIPPTYMRAAKSLGANDWTAFWRVYFPQSIPGVGAGAILCFILAIGYYITPELVGGTSGVFISNRIAYHISTSLNWGLAAALATLLLVVVIALYWTYDRIVGIDNVKLG